MMPVVVEATAGGDDAPNAALKEAGASFGKYTLLCRIATGGMGEIFVARQGGAGGFEKRVVIKRLLPHLAEDGNFIAMLLDEARIAARLSHPNVCQVHELGEVDGKHYIAMEYLEGGTAAQILRKARRAGVPLSFSLVAGLLRQVCDGLHHAHELADATGAPLGLVHRDVTPSNLFLTVPGVVKLLDFGVAKSKDALARTSTGALKGKFAYMSPEQVLGKDLDRRSDIFSLGSVYFELLTGKRLFWRESEYHMFQAIVEEPIPAVTSLRADVPRAVVEVVERAMSRDREERFASAAELGEAIERAMSRNGGVSSSHQLAEHLEDHFAVDLAAAQELIVEASAIAARPRASAEPTGETRARRVETESLIVPPPRKRRFVALAVVAVAVAAVVGALGWSRIAGGPPPAATPIVIQGGEVVSSDGRTTRVAGPADRTAPPPAGPSIAATADAGPRPRPASTAPPRDPYRAALASHQGAIRGCFNRHAAEVTGAPQVALALEIDETGRVVRGHLEPAALDATPLGGCLLDIARKVRFARGAEPVAVSIPLRIRRK
jgi:eukaryotic-like serine/threonine-protein kinase